MLLSRVVQSFVVGGSIYTLIYLEQIQGDGRDASPVGLYYII